MTWLKVDAHMGSHVAAWNAGDSALGLWLRMGCWLANYPEQGDFIPIHMAKHYGTKTQIRSLVESGLWDEADGGYRMHRRMDIASCGLTGPFWEIDDARPRAAIPASLRAAVYDRDGRRCVECGSGSDLSLDHIYPHSLGGDDTLDNLQTLCKPCNSRKGARV